MWYQGCYILGGTYPERLPEQDCCKNIGHALEFFG